MKNKGKRMTGDGRRDEQIHLDSLEDALVSDTNAKGGVIITWLPLSVFNWGKCPSYFKILLNDGTYNIN